MREPEELLEHHVEGLEVMMIDRTEIGNINLARECPSKNYIWGCRALICAVMDRALRDAFWPDSSVNTKDRLSALDWLSRRAMYPMGFGWCLHVLGLEGLSLAELAQFEPTWRDRVYPRVIN